MSRFTDYRAVVRSGPTAVAIGNFDGVHVGHRALLARVVAQCPARIPAVLTFSPHPVRLLAPHVEMPMVCSLDDRLTLLEAAGARLVLAQLFDREFSSLTADEFIERVLVDSLGVEHLVVGYDFEFGHGRAGDRETLRRAANALGFTLEVVGAQTAGDAVVASSSRVRQAVIAGQMSAAANILGRCFHVNGRVIRGEQRGRTIGFPTANVETRNELLPAFGVYSGWLDYGEGAVPAVINLGQKPTFVTDGALTLEAHVLDAEALQLYGLECRVFFRRHLRDELAFSGVEALRAQIALDADRAREDTRAAQAPTFP